MCIYNEARSLQRISFRRPSDHTVVPYVISFAHFMVAWNANAKNVQRILNGWLHDLQKYLSTISYIFLALFVFFCFFFPFFLLNFLQILTFFNDRRGGGQGTNIFSFKS